MGHQVRASLSNLKELAGALKDLEWYTGGGGYIITDVATEGGTAVWTLEPKPEPAPKAAGAGGGGRTLPAASSAQRRMVEAGDKVIIETKAQQISRRFADGDESGVEGVVFRVLTRGPHPHGMKVELRDRTVGRVKRNLTAPGAGEPSRGG